MFQSSRMAPGISRLHSSSACWPSSASLLLKFSPSRIRRATLRMTLESSTTRQVFIVPYSPPTHQRLCARSASPSMSRGQGVAGRLQYAINIEDHHELPVETMHTARNAGEVLIEIDGIRLARPVGELEHLADRINQKS